MLDTKPRWGNECPTDWKITFLKSEKFGSTVMAFHFAKPEGFGFIAGQFVDLTLINSLEMDDQAPSRSLTIITASFEDDLIFAVRFGIGYSSEA